jgi:flagellar biosynthetic protein FlhB
MAGDEDKSSKTEEATPKKRHEAFEKGNFAKAEEIQVVFSLVASFVVVLFVAVQASEQIALLMSYVYSNLSRYVLTAEVVSDYAKTGGSGLLGLLAPALGLAMISGILAGGLQSGFQLTPKVLEFKPEKLNPISGFKQKYGPQALVKFGIDFFKFVSIGFVIWMGVRRVVFHEIFYTRVEPIQIGRFIQSTTLYLLTLLIAAMAVLAVINFAYQKYKTSDGIKMSKQDLKDEHKQSDGDPMVKNARRQMARQLVERQMFASVPDADMIVTNPTHFAVALRYDREKDAAPIVLAKGKNLIAQKIKKLARECGVPIVENKPVARALYKYGKPGQGVPPQMYQVIAEVLAYVYRTNRSFFQQRRRNRKGVL